MLGFIGTHYAQLAAIVAVLFMIVLGLVSISDAMKNSSR